MTTTTDTTTTIIVISYRKAEEIIKERHTTAAAKRKRIAYSVIRTCDTIYRVLPRETKHNARQRLSAINGHTRAWDGIRKKAKMKNKQKSQRRIRVVCLYVYTPPNRPSRVELNACRNPLSVVCLYGIYDRRCGRSMCACVCQTVPHTVSCCIALIRKYMLCCWHNAKHVSISLARSLLLLHTNSY